MSKPYETIYKEMDSLDRMPEDPSVQNMEAVGKEGISRANFSELAQSLTSIDYPTMEALLDGGADYHTDSDGTALQVTVTPVGDRLNGMSAYDERENGGYAGVFINFSKGKAQTERLLAYRINRRSGVVEARDFESDSGKFRKLNPKNSADHDQLTEAKTMIWTGLAHATERTMAEVEEIDAKLAESEKNCKYLLTLENPQTMANQLSRALADGERTEQVEAYDKETLSLVATALDLTTDDREAISTFSNELNDYVELKGLKAEKRKIARKLNHVRHNAA